MALSNMPTETNSKSAMAEGDVLIQQPATPEPDNKAPLELLLAAAQDGDCAAYRQFLTRITPALTRMISRKVPMADVEDVLQNILISIHRARHTYDRTRNVSPWVAAIARFRLADYFRHHYRAEITPLEPEMLDMLHYQQQDVTQEAELPELVVEEIKKLPPRQQRILHLLHQEGYTAKETGERLGMKESAVKVAAHRAYKRIRARVGRKPDVA